VGRGRPPHQRMSLNMSGKWVPRCSYAWTPVEASTTSHGTLAHEHKPKLIIAASRRTRCASTFDGFARVAAASALSSWSDMAHYEGLIAPAVYKPGAPRRDVVTSPRTRGLRGSARRHLLMKDRFARADQQRDLARHPGGPLSTNRRQGGDLKEALAPEFKKYKRQVGEERRDAGHTLTQAACASSGRTESPRDCVDLAPEITGKEAGTSWPGNITATRTRSQRPENPMVTSGIRLGTRQTTDSRRRKQSYRQPDRRRPGSARDPQEHRHCVRARVSARPRALPSLRLIRRADRPAGSRRGRAGLLDDVTICGI